MKLIIIIASILLPCAMLYLNYKFLKIHILFTSLAFISSVIFGNIAAISIYNVIKDDALFMTTIHGIFLNPIFILSGSYIGLYIIYILLKSLTNNNSKV